MRITGWIMAVTLGLAPSLAAAQVRLDRPHRLLGEGVSLVVAGCYGQAIPKLTEAVRADPNLRNAHYNLGVAYSHTGELDRAIVEYQIAVQQTPRRDEVAMGQALYGEALAREANGERNAWSQYLSWAQSRPREQPALQIALARQAQLAAIRIPGTQKASR
jgi:tetratricopeptide (TPR) repeat protein